MPIQEKLKRGAGTVLDRVMNIHFIKAFQDYFEGKYRSFILSSRYSKAEREKHAGEINSLNSRILGLESEVESKSTEADRARSESRDHREQLETLAQSYSSIAHKNADLEEQAARAEDEKEKIRASLASVESERDKLTRETQDKDGRIEKQKRLLAGGRERYARALQQVEGLYKRHLLGILTGKTERLSAEDMRSYGLDKELATELGELRIKNDRQEEDVGILQLNALGSALPIILEMNQDFQRLPLAYFINGKIKLRPKKFNKALRLDPEEDFSLAEFFRRFPVEKVIDKINNRVMAEEQFRYSADMNLDEDTKIHFDFYVLGLKGARGMLVSAARESNIPRAKRRYARITKSLFDRITDYMEMLKNMRENTRTEPI